MLQKVIMPNESVLPEVRAKKNNVGRGQAISRNVTVVQPQRESIMNNNNNLTSKAKPVEKDEDDFGWKKLFFEATGDETIETIMREKLEPQTILMDEK